MRELLEENQRVVIIPTDFTYANKGTVRNVTPNGFTLDLDYQSDGILKNTYCEFYTETPRGVLYFESYAKDIDDKTLNVASPSRHKFLQRRQYSRIKFVRDLILSDNNKSHKIKTLDISAGGMKFRTSENIDIEGCYEVELPLNSKISIKCFYKPIRIERCDDGLFTHSGRFEFNENRDKMTIIQYCAKRSIEIENK